MPRIAPWLLAALIGICVYCVTLGGTYIYDDQFAAHNDTRLASVSHWGEFWTEAYYPHSQDRLYRPLTSMTFAIEWSMFGNRPWIFHLFNILLYAGVCAGVAELAQRLAGVKLAYFAGLLFAVHPVHVEAVAYLVGRSELLCTGAIVWSIVLLLPSGCRRSDSATHYGGGADRAENRLTPNRILLIAALLIVGLLSKEQAVLLPILVGAMIVLHLWRPQNLKEKKSIQIVLLILCWGVAAYVVGREYSPMKFSFDPELLDWTMQPLIKATGANRWLIPFAVLGRYAMLLVVPFRQAIDYGYAVTSYVQRLNDPFLWIGFTTAIVCLIAFLVALWKRTWLVAWCLVCMGFSYGIISNFPSLIGTIMGERLLFLPSVFFVILLAWLILKLPRRAAIGVLIVLVLLGSARTVIYAHQWNSRLSFYQTQTRENPKSVRTWWLLAEELDHRGQYTAALDATRQMQRIAPDYWISWTFAGEICMHAGQYNRALEYLNRAWHCKPTGPLEINYFRKKIYKLMK